MIESFSNL